jgi:succinoglycan biosynthesis transport protein ExoP
MLPLEFSKPETSQFSPGPPPGPVVVPPRLPRPSALGAAPDVVALLKALRRRWALALIAGLLCAGAATAATWYLIPPAAYSAQAVLSVSATPPRLLFTTAEEWSRFYFQNQLALIRSRLVLNAALRQPDVAKLPRVRQQTDPVEWLSKQIQASFEGDLFRISVRGDNPKELAILANALTEAYFREVVDAERTERLDRFNKLKEIYTKYQDTLQDKRQRLRKLAETAGSADKDTLAYKNQFAIERHGATERELREYQSELRRVQIEARILEAGQPPADSEPAIPSATIDAYVNQDSEVKQLIDQVDGLNSRMVEARRRNRSLGDPIFQKLRADLEAATRKLAQRRVGVRPRIVTQLRAAGRGPQEADLPVLRKRIEILKELIAVVGDEAKQLDEGTRSLNRTTLDLEASQDEIAQAELAAKRIGSEIEALNVELQAPPRIRLMEAAEAPHTKDDGKHLKMASLAGLGTFALVLFSVSWLEFQARRVSTVEEVVQGLGLKLLGSLPALPDRMRTPGPGAHKPRDLALHGLLIESVDAIRTMLLHDSRAGSHRTLMIASALGGEGKTSLASHLAISITRAGYRTLLVDCDLRRPMVHRLFDLPLEPGFSELLRGEVDLDAVIRPTAAVAGLAILTAGQCDATAIHALARGGVPAIFALLKQRYDFIIVDSAPVLPVADTLEIGQHVDAVVLSILRDISRVPRVYAAYERLDALGIRMLGAVVAGTSVHGYGYGYRYGYGYGYGHGHGSHNQLESEGSSAAPRPAAS